MLENNPYFISDLPFFKRNASLKRIS